ncbi:hypothetical protein [Pseudonocardia sp. GCM10023141]|uniref:hypothetical protein n=1 Tax=Pseudonocardia sp. GCM10023141 TaxID=3252653 RepID=UPI00362417AC
MPTSTNISLQILAVVAFAALRLAAPGWWLVLFVFSLIGPVLVLVPTIAALATARRGTLERSVAVPFVATAVLLVVAGATVPDFGDDSGAYLPFGGHVDGPIIEVMNGIGGVAVLGFVASLIWTLCAVASTRRPAAVRI